MNYKAFFFVLLLLIAGAFGYARYEASGPSDNYFNLSRRHSLGKSEFWRTVLNLNRVGDARAQYLGGSEPIVIEVLTSKNLEFNEEGLQKFASEVERITGRKTAIINVDTIDQQRINDADLASIAKGFRRHKQYGQPNIFVVYAGDFEGSDERPSKPFFDYGILVSDKKIKDLSSQYSQTTREYLASVLLNSFGYQLGLSENKNPDCIMQQEVLQPTRAILFSGKILPSGYCETEIEQASNIRKSLE